jgi:hypothetical protein
MRYDIRRNYCSFGCLIVQLGGTHLLHVGPGLFVCIGRRVSSHLCEILRFGMSRVCTCGPIGLG